MVRLKESPLLGAASRESKDWYEHVLFLIRTTKGNNQNK